MEVNKMISTYWRDWAALVYLFICLCDFFVGPLWWNLLMWSACNDVLSEGRMCETTRWTPLTLQAGALFHLSFGAILGVTSWKKSSEMKESNNKGNENNGD